MLSSLSRPQHLFHPRHISLHLRTLTTAETTPRTPRPEGDISSVFASLSNPTPPPLPARFATIKSALINGREELITTSFHRLLSSLSAEITHILNHGSALIPSLPFSEINNHSLVQPFSHAIKKRGAAIIRDVIPRSEVLGWKEEIRRYIAANPNTRGFPRGNEAVWECYWSPGQIKARAHPNMLEAERFLMGFWNCDGAEKRGKGKGNGVGISMENPVAYADRLRMRMPGDARFSLGPHVDGGSVERWEKDGYGKGGVYDDVFEGKWEDFDPWDASGRVEAESDLYNGAGACSMFRMYQGWLSMSNTGPGEGTLLVNPLFKLATAYYLLRPFFSPKNPNLEKDSFLDPSNWALDPVQTSHLQGAVPGCTQELTSLLHPHLSLPSTMIHIPEVRPGDYVAWHCDTIYSVDRIHSGTNDSSVLYIPICPLTSKNAEYLLRQREAFESGFPGPDFPGGEGESRHVGRMGKRDVARAGGREGLRATGFGKFEARTEGQGEVVRVANEILS